MARIAGVNTDPNKHIVRSLCKIYGISINTAQKICDHIKIEPTRKTNSLTEEELAVLRNHISENYTVEGDLRTLVSSNIKLLKDIACYRGLRHRRGLPVRGQNTHSNARTRKSSKDRSSEPKHPR